MTTSPVSPRLSAMAESKRSEREARLEKALRECDETLAALETVTDDHKTRVCIHGTRKIVAEALK